MTTDTLPRFGLAEAKDRLSALTASANETGLPFIITKGKKPWVEVRPLAVPEPPSGAVRSSAKYSPVHEKSISSAGTKANSPRSRRICANNLSV